MDAFIQSILVGMLGMACGSFVTLASYRLLHGGAIVLGRSQCPKCKQVLGWRQLFPVFSWLASRGRCARCGQAISLRYPLTELLTGGVFLLLWLQLGWSAMFLLMAVASTCLMIMLVTDIEHRILPDSVQLCLLGLGGMYVALGGIGWQQALAGFALGLGIGLLLHYGYFWLRKRHGLGLGDVKLFAVAGFWLGVHGLLPFFCYSGVVGVVWGIGWQLVTGSRQFPFGPALVASWWGLLVYPPMASWFWQLYP